MTRLAQVENFLIARNPDPDTVLPFLLRIPLAGGALVVRAKDSWPRTSKIYCHPGDDWPTEPDLIETVPVTSCVRRGNAIDLILNRSRENRSMFVFARARGRDVIFWQSARTAKQARPNVTLPTARPFGQSMTIIVDSHERYAWKFSSQQASTVVRALTVGDYAIEIDSEVIAVVERKSLADLVGTLTGGKLRYLMAALATHSHAALVVECRYSEVFKLDRIRPAVVADALAEAQIRFPSVPIIFAETRQLAQEWTYRFFGAALQNHAEGG
jgi:ERCC4 domain